MLFDSYVFLFCFLPICLIGYAYIIQRKKTQLAMGWLVIFSLFFYAWWDPRYLLLLLCSMSVNFLIGKMLYQQILIQKDTKVLLTVGVLFNLTFICFYKYFNFIIENLNYLHYHFEMNTIVLPLAISFFTFQQIGYLVDASKGEVKEHRFLEYCLFVTFFPQLIAGPIVQHKQLLPQLKSFHQKFMNSKTFSVGFTIFLIGLTKKIGCADNIAMYADCVFDAAAKGVALSFWEAWLGALAYALQLYFDFSGYSDMAVGLGLLFGIKLPINFNSPYKATNIIDFWRRWHITLSTFLRDYLYVPLGGNRRGRFRKYINILMTMFLGGLWHGANWTFVLWGTLHGIFLTINHFWRWLIGDYFALKQNRIPFMKVFYHMITLLAVISAWVIFRAPNFAVAKTMLHYMYSFETFSIPQRLAHYFSFLPLQSVNTNGMFYNALADWYNGLCWIAALILIALFGPNTYELMRKYRFTYGFAGQLSANAQGAVLNWRPTARWAMIMGLLVIILLMLLSEESEFLYFQF